MVENFSDDKRGMGRKEVLAAVLLLTMFVLVGRAAYIFWQEGDKICRALQGELAEFPAAERPCMKRSFLVGHFDWPSLRVPGATFAPSSVRYQFGDDGELVGLETDLGDDGTADITYRCSIIGKILMPMTNYAAWSSYSTFEGLARGGIRPTERVTDDAGRGVEGLHTRLTVVGEPDEARPLLVKSSTRDADERLQNRVEHGFAAGQLTISNYEYDANGALRSQRKTQVDHPYSITRQIDFTYECWE